MRLHALFNEYYGVAKREESQWTHYLERWNHHWDSLHEYVSKSGNKHWNRDYADVRDRSYAAIDELRELLAAAIATMPKPEVSQAKVTRIVTITRRLGLHPDKPLGHSRRQDERLSALRPSVAMMVLYPDPVIVEAVERRLKELSVVLPLVQQVLVRYNPVAERLDHPRAERRGWTRPQA